MRAGASGCEAKGVQIYQWAPKEDDPTKNEWVFKAPEADLLDADESKLGTITPVPTWESIDGSKVVGTMKAHLDSRDATAVPWLLVTAKMHTGKSLAT